MPLNIPNAPEGEQNGFFRFAFGFLGIILASVIVILVTSAMTGELP